MFGLILGKQLDICLLMYQEGSSYKFRPEVQNIVEKWRWATPFNYMYIDFQDFSRRLSIYNNMIQLVAARDKQAEIVAEDYRDRCTDIAYRYATRLHHFEKNSWLKRRGLALRKHKGITPTTVSPYLLIRNRDERRKIDTMSGMADMFKVTIHDGVMEHGEIPGDLTEGIEAPAEWDDADFSWDLNGSDTRRSLPTEEEVNQAHADWRKQQAAKRKEQRETLGETPAETLGRRSSGTPGGTLGETPEGTLGRTSSETPGRTLGETLGRTLADPHATLGQKPATLRVGPKGQPSVKSGGTASSNQQAKANKRKKNWGEGSDQEDEQEEEDDEDDFERPMESSRTQPYHGRNQITKKTVTLPKDNSSEDEDDGTADEEVDEEADTSLRDVAKRRTDIAVIKNPGEPTKVVLEYNTWKRLANIFYEADKYVDDLFKKRIAHSERNIKNRAQNKQKKQGGATSATSKKGDKGRGV
jgi:hypothetical protein